MILDQSAFDSALWPSAETARHSSRNLSSKRRAQTDHPPQTQFSYSPMIFTSTRFRRIPSNSP
jgi:hypothetical protein